MGEDPTRDGDKEGWTVVGSGRGRRIEEGLTRLDAQNPRIWSRAQRGSGRFGRTSGRLSSDGGGRGGGYLSWQRLEGAITGDGQGARNGFTWKQGNGVGAEKGATTEGEQGTIVNTTMDGRASETGNDDEPSEANPTKNRKNREIEESREQKNRNPT